MGSYSSALIPDAEEFDSIVSMAERLSEQVTRSMELERREKRSEEPGSSALREFSPETSQNGAALPAAEPRGHLPPSSPVAAAQSFTSLLPKALSAVLHARPGGSPAGHASPKLEELQTELRELRDQFEQMKSQHNKEIKLLMNELDEEKRIRLTLQMEVQRMKKHMNK